MYLTKEELIEQIEQIQADYFDISFEEIRPAMSYDLPDVRFGVIYPPQPMMKQTITERGEIRIEITAKITQPMVV